MHCYIMLYVLLLILLLVVLYWKCVKPHSYWSSRGVKQRKQFPIFGDNIGQIFKNQTMHDMVESVYKQFPNERFSGIYQFLTPMLLVRDPELIKQITVKDFEYFTDHKSIFPQKEYVWSKNLFSLKGDHWRDMRATLSPTFTSRKMRAMFELMSNCAKQIPQHFLNDDSKVLTVELKDLFSRVSNDVIATCAFGVQCDSLKDKDNEFYSMGRATTLSGFWSKLSFFMYITCPKICKFLGIQLFPNYVTKFFMELIRDTMKIREEQNIIRPDMVHLMMEAKKGRLTYDEDTLGEKESGFATVEESEYGKSYKRRKQDITLEDITAQALLFFIAGFDSVSTNACFIGYELAVNPDIQQRLFEEIHDCLKECDGNVTYEMLNKLKYLDMVVSETLRKWSIGAAIDRQCVTPYTIKSLHPEEPTVHLQEGDLISIPIWAIHRDPLYYPNPEKFDPERFSDENKENIKPYTFIPFGSGPRGCIASRFALLETKTIYFHILSKFEIVVVDKTPIPLKLSSTAFNITATNGFWLGLKPRHI